MTRNDDRARRIEAAEIALTGLSVGDALGEALMRHPRSFEDHRPPAPPHRWTDDTAMAVEVVGILRRYGTIDEAALARCFGLRYRHEPLRGYGRGAMEILAQIDDGRPWRDVSSDAFDGTGSMGNGSAMRVAPIGAWFSDDPERIVIEARKSALPTHFHEDGQAGAIAIAVAAGWAFRNRGLPTTTRELFDQVLALTPSGPTRDGILQAKLLDPALPAESAAAVLGNGSRVICSDTVPFTIWSAARSLDSYERAFWETAGVGGDVDTMCAIVGAVVALAGAMPPPDWIAAREPLPRAFALEAA